MSTNRVTASASKDSAFCSAWSNVIGAATMGQAITTDYRDILAEILVQRLYNPNVDSVFPNYTPESLGLFG